MTAPLHTTERERLHERWTAIGARTPRVAVRRIARNAVLGLMVVAGAFQLWNIGLWSVRSGTAWALAPLLFHLSIIGLALGLPLGSAALSDDSRHFAHRLRARYAARRARLSALRSVLGLECAVLIAIPPARTLLFGAPLQWGVTVVIAVCCLLIIGPISVLVAAEQRAVVNSLASTLSTPAHSASSDE